MCKLFKNKIGILAEVINQRITAVSDLMDCFSLGSCENLTNLKSDISQCTSKQAAAGYFYRILDDEIKRIQTMCEEWNSYKV